jgi:hypothetical protein
MIEAVTEPKFADASAKPGSFEYRGQFIAPYIQLLARRTDKAAETETLWVPEG